MEQFTPAIADNKTFSLDLPRVNTNNYVRDLIRIKPQTLILDAFLVGQISNDFIITQPLQINVERDDDGTYIVSDSIFLVYGNGENQSDAVHDYVDSLIEFYKILKKSSETNAFDLKLFSKIEKYVLPKSQGDNDAIQAIRD